jgi:hypothetical protein
MNTNLVLLGGAHACMALGQLAGLGCKVPV